MIGKILQTVEKRNLIIEELEKEARYYPEVSIRNYGGYFWIYTKVRICDSNGVWHTVFCARDFPDVERELAMLNLLHMDAYKIQHCWAFNGGEKLDELQITETERLTKLFTR